MTKIKIVCIEDDEADFFALKRSLKPILGNIDLVWIDTPANLKKFKESAEVPNLILLDFQFPGVDFIDVIQYYKSISSDIEIAMLTAYQEPNFKESLNFYGITHIFDKDKLKDVFDYISNNNIQKISSFEKPEESNENSTIEKKSNEERRLFHGAFISIAEPVVFLDLNFNIFFTNPAYSRLAENEFQNSNNNFIELIHSEKNRIRNIIQSTRLVESQKIDVQIKNKYGELLLVETSCSFVPKENGYYCLIFKNYSVTESHQESLKTIEYYKKLIPKYFFSELTINGNPQILINQNFQTLGLNQRAIKLFEEKITVGENFLKIISPKNAILVSAKIQSCINHSISFPFNLNNLVCECYINPIVINSQERIYSLSFVEMSNRPSIDNIIIDPSRNAKQVMDNSKSIIYYLNNKGEVIYVSDNYETITGFSKQDILLKPLGSNQEIAIQENVKNVFVKLANLEIREATGYGTVLTKDKKTKNLRYSVESIVDVNGNFIGVSGVFTDVTDVFQTTKALQKSEESLNQIVTNIQEAIFIIDQRFRISYVTPNCLQITGYTSDELLGQRFINFIHPDDIDVTIKFMRKNVPENVLEGRIDLLTVCFKKKNGTNTYLETLFKKVDNLDEKKISYIGTSRIVDDKIAINLKLQETKRQLELITKIQKLYIKTDDINATFRLLLDDILKQTKSDFGCICEVSFDENGNPNVRSIAFADIAYGQDSQNHATKFDEIRNLKKLFGTIFGEKKPYINNDVLNDIFTGEISAEKPKIKTFIGIPIFRNHEMVSVLGLANNSNGYSLDLTEKLEPFLGSIGFILEKHKIGLERIKSRQEIAKSEAQIKAILTSIEDIVLEINDELVITNAWAKDIENLAIPKHHYLNKKFETLIKPYPFTLSMYNILLEVAKDDIERVFEYTLQKNNETIWNQCRIFTLTKELKKTYCVQISDITKTKNAEENLRQMLIQEKELTLLKSRFITLTSHEFRTPLTTISSSNELISMQLEKSKIPISDKLKKYTDIIQSEVIHMSDLLNSLLKLGKIDSNKLVINLSDLNMEEAVAAIMEKLLLTQKIPRKIETIIKGKPYNIKMDVKILEMIIENITSNAFKYSQDRPDPILEIDFQESKLVLILQDFGIGIPVLDQPKLFEQFFRASNVGKIKGVGLGLVIVKNMVELLQGNLKIESEEGKGTRIKIDFKNNI